MQRSLVPIRLRQLQLSDKEDYIRWRLDPRISGVMRGGVPNETELNTELEMRFNKKRPDEIYLCIEIQAKNSNSLVHVGDIRLRKIRDRKSYAFDESHGVWELGHHCDPDYWGDVELSATVAMLDLAFKLRGAVRVEDTIWTENIQNINMKLKAGFSHGGVMRKRVWRNDEWLDEINMGITDDEYANLWGNTSPHWNFDEIRMQV